MFPNNYLIEFSFFELLFNLISIISSDLGQMVFPYHGNSMKWDLDEIVIRKNKNSVKQLL